MCLKSENVFKVRGNPKKKRIAPGGIRQTGNQRELNNSSIKKLFKKGEFALKCVYSNVDQLLYKMCTIQTYDQLHLYEPDTMLYYGT